MAALKAKALQKMDSNTLQKPCTVKDRQGLTVDNLAKLCQVALRDCLPFWSFICVDTTVDELYDGLRKFWGQEGHSFFRSLAEVDR